MKTVRILFFDDDRNRHTAFVRMCELAGLNVLAIAHAYDIEAAIRLLDSTQFAAAFLDHDLDGMVMCKPGPRTGLAVAQHIATMPEERAPDKVVVHSYNPEGVRAMMEALQALAGEGRAVAAYWDGDEFHRLVYAVAGWQPPGSST